VFARGTSEPAGIGRVGQAVADTLEPQLGGRTLGTYAVTYPATYDFLAGSNQLKRSFGTEQYQLCWSHIRKPTIAFRAEQFARSTLGLLKRRNGQP